MTRRDPKSVDQDDAAFVHSRHVVGGAIRALCKAGRDSPIPRIPVPDSSVRVTSKSERVTCVHCQAALGRRARRRASRGCFA